MISLTKLARAIHQPFYGFLDINANSATQKKSAQLVTSLHTSSFNARWHKDKVENRDLYRHGYVDRVKQSGALPRISEDSPRVKEIKVFRPSNPFAPKEALFGQNDYIDILGDDPDAFRPAELNYQAPEWLREIPGNLNHYQMALKKKEHLAKTCYPKNSPYSWLRLNKRIEKQYRQLRKMQDQFRWTNYKGIKSGDVSQQGFKTRYPF